MKKTNNALFRILLVFILISGVMSSCGDDSEGGGNKPKISSIIPQNVATGDNVTILGTNLANSTILIEQVSAVVLENTETSIVFIVPSGTSISVQEVIVQNPIGTTKGTITVSSKGAPPVITNISPSSVSIGDQITITGTGLNNAFVEIYQKAATISANTATSITATVPAGIAVGGQAAVGVTTPLGYIVSGVNIK